MIVSIKFKNNCCILSKNHYIFISKGGEYFLNIKNMSLWNSFDDRIYQQGNQLPEISLEKEADELFNEELDFLIDAGIITVSDSVSSIIDK